MAIFTVYFEAPWWVGVLEVEDAEGLRAHRHVFGPEPTGPAILAVVTQGWSLLRATPAVAVAPPPPLSPKRAARERARQAREPRPSTRAQEALAATRAQGKEARKARTREAREADQARRRALARERARAKHRGH